MKHGIANESVALTEYVSLLTTHLVTVNLVQPGLFFGEEFCLEEDIGENV